MRIRPKISVKPLATRKYSPPSVMPFSTALRNTRLRPIAASSPGGQIANTSHASTATAMITISAQAGWRSMNLAISVAFPQLVATVCRAACPISYRGRRLRI
ncbi:hypothetical protein ACVW17_007566 [Bradyrhizobium sp. USDA 4473]